MTKEQEKSIEKYDYSHRQNGIEAISKQGDNHVVFSMDCTEMFVLETYNSIKRPVPFYSFGNIDEEPMLRTH